MPNALNSTLLTSLYEVYRLQSEVWRAIIFAVALVFAVFAFVAATVLIEYAIQALPPIRPVRIRWPRSRRQRDPATTEHERLLDAIQRGAQNRYERRLQAQGSARRIH